MAKTCERFNGYEGLANAIVQGACIDYLKTKKKLATAKSEKRIRALTVQLAEHILFFHSTWYAKLSPDTDGETVLDKLDEAYKELKDIDNLKRIDELEITW